MITSLQNERIKSIRKLQERKYRQESGQFFIEGLRIVGEALESGAKVECIVVAPDVLRSEQGWQWVNSARQSGQEIIEVSEEVFQRLSLKEGPQGLAAVVQQQGKNLAQIHLEPGKPWVALDSTADPGNLGTILRSNDGAGGAGVILLDHSTDPYDPSAVRASMGALFSQQLVKTTRHEFAGWKAASNCVLVGTADSAYQNYHEYQFPEAFILLMGSEREGLPDELVQLCDAMVSIPMLGKSDSLNLAVATGVVLYESLNQRRDRAKNDRIP